MKNHRRPRQNKNPASLGKLVEREIVPTTEASPGGDHDGLDSDINLYLQSFLKDFMSNKPLPATNLLTQESAQRALEMISKTQEHLSRQLKTARALKGLLEQKQRQ